MRKIGRKSLFVLLALLLVIGCFSGMCPVSAAGSADLKIYQDTIYYTVSAMQEVTIKSARSAVTEAVIPAELDGCPVTEIGEYAFKDCTRLKRVVLPDTIRRIGEFAFKDCSRLTELSIPDTVSEIGWGIVQGTSWLENQTSDFVSAGQGILLAYTGTEKDVTVPDTVRAVGGYAFDGCTTVETVQLPSSLRSIDAFAFSNCINLRQMQIADGLESIGEYAFHWCVSLEQIELPDSVKNVGGHGFSYCRSLRKVRLSQAMTQISNTLFQGCSSLTEIELPENIKTIYNYAFDGCAALQKIVLPAAVEEMGASAFSGCGSLEQLVILNPACRIYDTEQTVSSSTCINGFANSTAEIYARKYSRQFRPIDRQRGDMDGDGSLDTSDLFLLLYLCACRGAGVQTNPTSVELYCADYNADGKIDNLDVYDLMMHLAKVGAGLAEK